MAKRPQRLFGHQTQYPMSFGYTITDRIPEQVRQQNASRTILVVPSNNKIANARKPKAITNRSMPKEIKQKSRVVPIPHNTNSNDNKQTHVRRKQMVDSSVENEEKNMAISDIRKSLASINKLCIKLMSAKYGEYNVMAVEHFQIDLDKHVKLIKMNAYKHSNIPDPNKYESWNLKEIESWIWSLGDGRYRPYLDKMMKGFEESGIVNGEFLPDLTTADLSVPPFNIKSFRDKRDLIATFRSLRCDLDKSNNYYKDDSEQNTLDTK